MLYGVVSCRVVRISRASGQQRHHEKRSPFGLLYGVLLSYLLFSTTLCPSVAGACRVGAGSPLASWLGDPEGSVRAGVAVPLLSVDPEPPMAEADRFFDGTLFECSSESIICFFRRASSNRACRSALMLRFAKKYAPPPAASRGGSVSKLGEEERGGNLPTQRDPQPSLVGGRVARGQSS